MFSFSFWTTLITDTIPLLECDEIIFSSTETFIILQCLQEKEHSEDLSDKLDILRFAASRNLARALIYEAQN